MSVGSSPSFKFERARGIVWVCDVANSTSVLNDNTHVDALEDYLPRLYWVALQAVHAAGGVFIKWTGDGFLAWFPALLERELGTNANNVFTAAWHLTFLSNLTTLGVKTEGKIRLRHGAAYEPDALVLRIEHSSGHVTQDLIGRAVVRAFRMSSIACPFPSVVTESVLVKAYQRTGSRPVDFERRRISTEEVLRYFKGEKVGTSSLYVPRKDSRRVAKAKTLARRTKRILKELEKPLENPTVATKFSGALLAGPPWARKAALDLYAYVDKKVVTALREAVPVLEERGKAIKADPP